MLVVYYNEKVSFFTISDCMFLLFSQNISKKLRTFVEMNYMKKKSSSIITALAQQVLFFLLLGALLTNSGCSSTKHLEDNEYLLNSVKIVSTDPSVNPKSYRSYVRQEANSKWFNLFKVPLAIYNTASTDSTRRINRILYRIGEAPVVYEQYQTELSKQSLAIALQNQGYLHAKVKADTLIKKQKKVDLIYQLTPGRRSYIKSFRYSFDNAAMQQAVMEDSAQTLIHVGKPLDANTLQAERSRIIDNLRNKGYYRLNKEYISYTADTLYNEDGIGLTLHFQRPHQVDTAKDYRQFTVKNVNIYENMEVQNPATDSVRYRGLHYFFNHKIKLSKRVYNSHIYIREDSLFHKNDIENTYASLNGLSSINYSTIQLYERDTIAPELDCDIRIKTNKPNTVSAELEGTNTSGDLGAAVTLTYNHRNFLGGAENFAIKLRGAYEAITGLEGYSNANYVEYSVETTLKFPTFIFPWLTEHARQYLKSSSELTLMYDSQNRPEFHRRVLTGNWGYRWNANKKPKIQHRFDLIGINYIFMPWISKTFKEEYLEGDDPRYGMLRSSYENLLIMRMGYNFTYNSLRNTNNTGLLQTNGYQFKINLETAGNLLSAISKITGGKKDNNNQYNLFNIAYSQYAKFDFDFAKSFLINERNSIAMHMAFGIAIPYGNSTIIPYEKRYFSGGANSVRGWSVRGLGPGSYICKDGKIDFINQTGNLKLDLSLEYRTQLFSKFHGAFFIDAGNIWNTRNYPDQPGGQFKFNKFYKQIAVAYGLGLRLNLDYFILRLDGGMKAIDPSHEKGKLHYPLLHPNFDRDFTLHFAVGLPF